MQLTGHTGYTFSCSWHPAGSLLATGNEDHSARIYDIRKPESSTHVLGARMAAIRSVRFSPSGDCLAVMEMTDFVTFYNATTSFNHSTTLDFFGECSGVDFSPNGEYAYVGCAEAERGGIIEMKRPSMGWLSTINEYFL
jgi:WD40 repeat protein